MTLARKNTFGIPGKNETKMSARLVKVSFDEVEKHFDEIQNWNDRINLMQLSKSKDSMFDWWAMVVGDDEWVSVAGIDKLSNEDAIYLNEVMAKSGRGYGAKMIRGLYHKYKGSGKSKFYFDAETNGGLAEYYKKMFSDFEVGESPWETPEFTKWYKEKEEVVSENTKFTLTLKQLKSLISEVC